MAQSLLIGLGGTGSRVVNNVVKLLKKNKLDFNNGQICCAVLDTNKNDTGDIRNSGTQVPIFETSKPQRISDYFDQYHHLDIHDWAPDSPAFRAQSMLDGCSEVRVKSRIAFLDCLHTNVINELGIMINDVLRNSEGSKIRVMIVSSLSGGTGSGMFIQVALWLRQYLSKSQITIRGIFLLPDVFVSTIKDIRENKETTARHYANAYASVRELNGITKIKKSIETDLAERIKIGSLFDSDRDSDNGDPVYDLSFFVDDRDENGVKLSSIGEYEQMVAQLVYMQLYAPMSTDMYSEEDNAFLSFDANDEPLYGTCGTAKAEYPTDSVKTYCAIRAAQDSLQSGWRKIDSEIEARIEEKKAAERDGIFTNTIIEPRTEYIKLFDEKTSVRPEEAGSDRFFVSIAKDVKNENKSRTPDGKVTVIYSDKVDDLLRKIKSAKIETHVTRNSEMAEFMIEADSFVKTDHTEEELKAKFNADESDMEDALNRFDEKVDEYSSTIVNSIFPLSMGDVNSNNEATIYGLLTKPNDEGTRVFVHPVAARYLLCKLVAQMERELKGIVLESSRSDALTGGDVGTGLDNPKTRKTETTPLELLESRKGQRLSKFLDLVEEKYAEFINTKVGLCEKYEKECLQVSVYRKLIERVNALITQLEYFFKRLKEVQDKLTDDLAVNIAETDGVVGKTYYVYGSGKYKEAIYKSIDLGIERSIAEINKNTIDTAYGKLCAEKRPTLQENKKYKDLSVTASFLINVVRAFRARIDNDPNNSDLVNLNIYSAICKQYDFDRTELGEPARDELHDIDLTDTDSEPVSRGSDRTSSYEAEFKRCRDKLLRLAAPMLIRSNEVSDNKLGTITTLQKTFWGFHPSVVATAPNLGAMLQVNADIQADTAYPINELYCYRAVYGVEARYIPKFNELGDGLYYASYKAVVDDMVRDAAGRRGERAYVASPHIDKRWHAILPYVTSEKIREDNDSFFRGFWLAIAYGKLKLNKEGNFCVVREIDAGFNTRYDDEVELEFNGKPIGKADIHKLISVLKMDIHFKSIIIPALEERFKSETDAMDTYVGTTVLKGLTVKNSDLNPVDIIARYSTGLGKNKQSLASLFGALESIAMSLASHYDLDRDAKRVEEAKYRICKRIYDSSTRVKGKAEVFANWINKFKELGIKTESETDSE